MSKKEVSRGLALEISSRVGPQTNWGELDGDKLHAEVATLSPREFGRRMTAFFRNGMRISLGGLVIPTVPFVASNFPGFRDGLDFGHGSEKEYHDEASTLLTEVDFIKVEFVACLEEGDGGCILGGGLKLARLKETGRVLLGASVAMGLWHDYQSCENKFESVIETLYQRERVTYVDFFGDVFCDDDRLFVLCFRRCSNGQWFLSLRSFQNAWTRYHFTAVAIGLYH
jgi:hypothetical protein